MFDRDKLARSIAIAVRKRPVSEERVEKIVNSIQRRLESSGEPEIQSRTIGEYASFAAGSSLPNFSGRVGSGNAPE